MESHDPSRRSLLHTLAAVIAAATTPFGWAEIAQAMQHAHTAAQTGTNGTITFLSSVEAADIEAVAAQIVPSDDSPGAREAGVVYFIDRGSSLVTSGRGQPTMTIQALAFRAGEHIARFAKRGEI